MWRVGYGWLVAYALRRPTQADPSEGVHAWFLCCRYVAEPLPDGTEEKKVLPPFQPKKSKGLLDSLMGKD